jgi:hypothetical protein
VGGVQNDDKSRVLDCPDGPVVKWYYAAFALLSREFDSPQVHKYENNAFISVIFVFLIDKKD